MLDLSDKFLFEKLQKSNKPIVLYGMGDGADKIIALLNKYNIVLSGVFVSDGFVRDMSFHGHKLCSYSDMCDRFDDFIVLVSFGTSLPDVMANIIRISKERELYAPYVPVIGEGIFDRAYLNEHMHDFHFIYDTLADEKSRHTFQSILNYRITGDISYLSACESATDDIYRLLDLSDDEVYCDLGAYNGDTVSEFIAHTKGYRKIYAVEPDKKTFGKLEINTSHYKNIHLYNAAVYSHSRGVSFDMRSGRNSRTIDSGKTIPSVSIDECFSDATYIKMDIEGAELQALNGAESTLVSNSPKLLISCYHRTEDLYSIPQKVLNINNEYKIYMSHRPYFPDWDTEYLFIKK